MVLAGPLSGPSYAFAQDGPDPCAPFDLSALAPVVRESGAIVIAVVHAHDDTVSLMPQVYLKGPATERPIELGPASAAECEPAALVDGSVVLAALSGGAGGTTAPWPAQGRTRLLATGGTVPSDEALLADEIVAGIRGITGQFAVPAAETGSGIGFDVTGSILPVGLAMLFILAAGLVLMRLWHRIDPS